MLTDKSGGLEVREEVRLFPFLKEGPRLSGVGEGEKRGREDPGFLVLATEGIHVPSAGVGNLVVG